jgi:MHS family proline/betaine transporter-like MFS transporter
MNHFLQAKFSWYREHQGKLKLLFPAILGTLIEYYDYALYGLSAVVLTEHFFPEGHKSLSLIKAFGIFFAGSLAKPIGALYFGRLSDTLGRSVVLKITMLGIAVPTTLIGLLPDYETIGWLAPLLLLFCRLLQGIFIGGEYDGVRLFVFETFGEKEAHLINTLTNMSTMLGIYIASLFVMCSVSPELPNWFWRVPFLLSGFFGGLVFWFRKSLQETPAFLEATQNNKHYPKKSYRKLIFANRVSLTANALRWGTVGGSYHFYLVFWGTYLCTALEILQKERAIFYTSQAILTYTLSLPVAAWLSDRFNPMMILRTSLIWVCCMVLLNAFYVSRLAMPEWVMLLTAGSLAFFNVPGILYFLKAIPVEERQQCIGLGHTVGSLLFSGSTPLISTLLWEKTESSIAPLYHLLFLILLGFFAVVWQNLFLRKRT